MADISRLRDTEISNGNSIDADDLDAEFDQLITAHNSQDARLTSLESSNMTIAGVKTFTSTPLMNAIDERTAGSGVTVDGALIQDGNIRLGTIRALVTLSSGVDTGTDIITTSAAHGLTTADAVRVRATSGSTLPTGLSASTQYYARVLTTTTITLHPTAADATGNTNIVNITAVGSGTMQIIGNIASPVDGDVWYNDGLKYQHLGSTQTVPVLSNITATQADQETATSTTTFVAPGRQHFHPGHPKSWVFLTTSGGTPTVTTSYGVTSVTDNGVGNFTINMSVTFSSANYCVVTGLNRANAATVGMVNVYSLAATNYRLSITDSAGAVIDPTSVQAVCMGDF